MVVHGGQKSSHKPLAITGRCIQVKPVSPLLKPEVIGCCLRPVMTRQGSKAQGGVGNPLFLGFLIMVPPPFL